MKILFWDNGLNTELAISLARAGHSVGYSTPWQEAFPKAAKAYIGKGLEGLTPVENFSLALPKVDLVVCPDTFSADRVEQARQANKPVWGAGRAERLELDRPFFKDLMKQLGLPIGPYEEIHGVDALIKYLKTHNDKWIKTSKWRQLETFKHDDWESTRSTHLGHLLDCYGPAGEELTFLSEEPLKGQEVGLDRLYKRGLNWVRPAGWGYEAKDEAYIGTWGTKLPPVLQEFCDKMDKILWSFNCNTFICNEVIVGKDKTGKVLEPTVRCPHPPTAGMLEMYMNIPAVITGNDDELKPIHQYCAVLVIRSSWAGDHWTEIKIKEPDFRSCIKLSQACRIGDKFYAVPGNEFVAYAVGVGDTPEDAATDAKETADQVSCKDMDCNYSALDKLVEETVPEGKKVGINF